MTPNIDNLKKLLNELPETKPTPIPPQRIHAQSYIARRDYGDDDFDRKTEQQWVDYYNSSTIFNGYRK